MKYGVLKKVVVMVVVVVGGWWGFCKGEVRRGRIQGWPE